jgi:hypothetical protein
MTPKKIENPPPSPPTRPGSPGRRGPNRPRPDADPKHDTEGRDQSGEAQPEGSQTPPA